MPRTPNVTKSGSTPSSTSTTNSTATSKATHDPANSPLPPAYPIHSLSTPTAKSVNHVHTLVVPLVYISRFNATVADPVNSLTQLLLPVAILQAVYSVVCLPVGVSSEGGDGLVAKGGAVKEGVKRGKKANAQTSTLSGRIIPAILSLLLTALLAFPPLLILLVLHGAPVTTHHPQTLLLAFHLALLATPPLFYTHGVGALPWRQLVSLSAPFDEVKGAALGAIFGAWLGAIPIPLDWDREWQKWPVTVVTGVYGGWVAGKALGGTIGWGRVANFA